MAAAEKKSGKEAASLKIENDALEAKFEIFLPPGWRVERTSGGAKKKDSPQRKTSKKTCKR